MIKDKPTTNIERIDYQFDQLKIERLEGTLNIGLNPSDPNSVQNFEVGQTTTLNWNDAARNGWSIFQSNTAACRCIFK